ncbi:MAG: hypothetical protein K2L97_06815 [Muribaculaceae bacterium]|nr:hypothetical protein [Muribaculaceae bacterium]
MATYKSKPAKVNRNINELYERFSDMSRLQSTLDELPAEQRSQIGDVEFTSDSLKIVTPQVGEIKFVIKEKIAPNKIVFGTESSPVPLTMEVCMTPDGDQVTEVETRIDVEIPAIVRPIIGPQLQKAADKFGELITGLSL